MLNEKEIQNRLTIGIIGNSIRIFQQVDSTNAYAKSILGSSTPEGTVILAEEQTAGKGRMGRTWTSAAGKNLTFSVILYPKIPAEKMGLISLMAAAAMAEALEESRFPVHTKWPNDLLIDGKKVCGILSEMVTLDGAVAVIVGIGLNVNQMKFSNDIEERATSLALHRGERIDRMNTLITILTSLEKWYMILQQQGYDKILLRWKQSCRMLGHEIALIQEGSRLHGTALDIAPDGGLILLTGKRTITIYAGDVSLSMENGKWKMGKY